MTPVSPPSPLFARLWTTSRRVVGSALHLFVVDVAQDGMIDFRPLHPLVRVLVLVGLLFTGLFMLGLLFNNVLRLDTPLEFLATDSQGSPRAFSIPAVIVPIAWISISMAWGLIVAGALYARPLIRWTVFLVYAVYFVVPMVTRAAASSTTFLGDVTILLFIAPLLVLGLLLLTFLVFPLLSLSRGVAWLLVLLLHSTIPLAFWTQNALLQPATGEEWLTNSVSSVILGMFLVTIAYLLISGLGWIDFALQTSGWLLEAVQQNASRAITLIFLILFLLFRLFGMGQALLQGGFDGNATVGAAVLLLGMGGIAWLRRRLPTNGTVSFGFLVVFAALIPLGQYLASAVSQFSFAFVLWQIADARAGLWANQVYHFTLQLSTWETQWRSIIIALIGVVVWIAAIVRRNGMLATFGIVLAWTQAMDWLTRYGRPLAPFHFEYAHIDLLLLVGTIVGLLWWLRRGELTHTRVLQLFGVAILLALLNQTDFLDNPFSPLFGFAGVSFLVFSIFWNMLGLAGLFVNRPTPGLSRESRALLYVGYALLAVTVSYWYAASHNVAMQILQNDLSVIAFHVLGYPLAFTVVIEGGRSLFADGVLEGTAQTMTNSTQRFSDRVDNYVRYRPTYPDTLLASLRAKTGLLPDHVIADIGSGTGISTELFLKNGNTVYAVEPNDAMRGAAESLLASYPNFHSVNGTAEATTFTEASVDYVVAGQAFHWFDKTASKAEFQRILRPDGWVALFWNNRQTDTSPFLRAYEQLLQEYATDYNQVNHTNVDDAVFRAFFRDGAYETITFPNAQYFDYEGLKGRLLSSSYAPNADDPRSAPMLEALQRIFAEHHVDGQVAFEYMTELHIGHV